MTQQTNLDTLLDRPANHAPGIAEDYRGSDQGLTSMIDEDEDLDDDEDLDEDELDVEEIDVAEGDVAEGDEELEADVVPTEDEDDLDGDLSLDEDDDEDEDEVV